MSGAVRGIVAALLLLGTAASASAGAERLKELAATVTPSPLSVAPGFEGELTLSLAPRTQYVIEPGEAPRELFWNNNPAAACALRVKSAPDGLTVTPAELNFPRPDAEHSNEVRRARLTVKVAPGTPGGRYPVVVALSYACCTIDLCLLPQTEELTFQVEVTGSQTDWGPALFWTIVLLLVLVVGGVVIALARRYSLGGK